MDRSKGCKKRIKKITKALDFSSYRHFKDLLLSNGGQQGKAYARIWAMPKIFQNALGIKPAYVIEVLSKYYDRLNEDGKSEAIIHELLHIPKFLRRTALSQGTKRHIGHDANALLKKIKTRNDYHSPRG